MNNSLRIAIAHDYLNQMGGAEKCVEVMHDIFPQAPVYTSIYNPDVMDSCFSKMDLRLSFMQKLPLIQKCFRYYLPLYPFAFQHFDFGSYDVVLSSSSAFAKGIHTNSKTCHICYCYTPMRFAWNYHSYVERERLGLAARMILPGIIAPLKYWDRKNSPKVDYFIAISQAVAERIRKHYQRDSKIIYPPVNTKHFTPAHDSIGDYFLVVSRLIPYKRIDLVVEAFNQTGLPLKIVGGGRDSDRLQAMARPNIEFLGRIPDEEVRYHFAHCKALIFPGEEDFGLTPVEAQASGRPVIAYAAGGALETIQDKQTGLFFHEQTPESLAEAVTRFSGYSFNSDVIRENALKFDESVFKRELAEYISAKIEEFHTDHH